jgi:hypothetical protein
MKCTRLIERYLNMSEGHIQHGKEEYEKVAGED